MWAYMVTAGGRGTVYMHSLAPRFVVNRTQTSQVECL